MSDFTTFNKRKKHKYLHFFASTFSANGKYAVHSAANYALVQYTPVWQYLQYFSYLYQAVFPIKPSLNHTGLYPAA